MNLELIKNKGGLTWLPFLRIIFLTITSFLSWNYFGAFFIINLIYFFKYVVNEDKRNTFTKLLIFIYCWLVGAIFWMIDLDLGIAAIIIVFIVYFLVFYFFLNIIYRFNLNHIIFIPLFLCFELFFNYCGSTFPWLTLGNLFANISFLVPFISIVGVTGCSALLLLTAYFISNFRIPISRVMLLLIVVIVCLINFRSRLSINFEKEPTSISIVSVNKDKFKNKIQDSRFIFDVINYSGKKKNNYLILPELTIRGLNNENFVKSKKYRELKSYFKKDATRKIILGTSGIVKGRGNVNSAMLISDNEVLIKNKDKLVPYTEYIPNYLRTIISKPSYVTGIADNRERISLENNLAVFICYEAMYPYYFSSELNSSPLAIVLSSERFMNNNRFGKIQYDNIIKLRAIENSIYIAKASNGGNTLLINPIGELLYCEDEKFNEFNVDVRYKNSSVFNKFGIHINILIIVMLFLFSIIKKLK